MVRYSVFEALEPKALEALTVKETIPTAVGVPVITPAGERLKPDGVAPTIDHDVGSLVACKVAVYDEPVYAGGRDSVMITGPSEENELMITVADSLLKLVVATAFTRTR